MATFRLKTGGHYHQWPPVSTLPWVGERRIERIVEFSADCAYLSSAYNGQDVNKLFGLSFGWRGVHHNSARFGWRWSQADQCIELLAYVYNEGVRNWDEQLRFPVVAQVRPGEILLCDIRLQRRSATGKPTYLFEVVKGSEPYVSWVSVDAPDGLPHYGLTHGLYYGGALPCPHDMAVRIDRV